MNKRSIVSVRVFRKEYPFIFPLTRKVRQETGRFLLCPWSTDRYGFSFDVFPTGLHVKQDGDGNAREERACHLAGHEADGEPLEDGVEQDDSRPDDNGGGGEEHRPEADRTGFDDGFRER